MEDAERFLLGHNVLSQQEAREHHQYFLSVYSLINGCIVCQVQTLVHQARQSKTAHGLPDYHDRTKMALFICSSQRYASPYVSSTSWLKRLICQQ